MKTKKIPEMARWETTYKWHELVLLYGSVILYCIMIIIPFWAIIAGSISSSELIELHGVGLWPRGFSGQAYKMVFLFPGEILQAYGLTLCVTLLGIVMNFLFCTTIAYALSKPYFNGKRVVTLYLMFTVLFGAGYIPEYIIIRNYYKLFDTMWILFIKPTVSFGEIVFLRVFYQGLPVDLFESAELDGANEFRCFMSIGTPLILPGLATFMFRCVLGLWNDPMTAMLFTDHYIPISLYLTRVTQYLEFLRAQIEGGFTGLPMDEELPSSTMVFAMAIVTSAPMLFVFTFFQKYFVRGATSGAVKG